MIGGMVGAIVLGLVCGYLLKAVVRIGIFLGGLLIGGLVGTQVLGQSLWVILVILLSGILAAVFFRHFVMAATALWGAILLTGSVASVVHFSGDRYPVALATIELAAFAGGLTYQFLHAKKESKTPEGAAA
jgi:hypothetical protein